MCVCVYLLVLSLAVWEGYKADCCSNWYRKEWTQKKNKLLPFKLHSCPIHPASTCQTQEPRWERELNLSGGKPWTKALETASLIRDKSPWTHAVFCSVLLCPPEVLTLLWHLRVFKLRLRQCNHYLSCGCSPERKKWVQGSVWGWIFLKIDISMPVCMHVHTHIHTHSHPYFALCSC